MRIDDPDHVREQYADETRLATRTAEVQSRCRRKLQTLVTPWQRHR